MKSIRPVRMLETPSCMQIFNTAIIVQVLSPVTLAKPQVANKQVRETCL